MGAVPIYVYKHPSREEYIEVFQHMNDKHEYSDLDGLSWDRVLLNPNMSIDSNIDPWSNADFVNKTENKKGSYGDLQDQSAELSSQRAKENNGVDPLKQNYFNKYSKERGGKKHHLDTSKTIENKNIKIEF
jgi:hypothetical protein